MIQKFWDRISYAVLSLLEPFRFFKHAHERRAQEMREMHERSVDLIETIFDRIQAMEKTRTEAAIAASQAQAKQAEAMQVWIELFKVDTSQNSPGVTVRPADEAFDERNRERERLLSLGYPIDSSPDEQLAWLLSQELVTP